MECSRMAVFSPVFPESLTATARRVPIKLPIAYGCQFVDQSHAVFYGKASTVTYRRKCTELLGPCKSGVQFEMATVDDESVEDVIRQLEDLQRKVKAKKKELKAKKKMMKVSKKASKKESSSSSSSSESSESSDSSDDECDKMNMKMLRKKMKGNGTVSSNATPPAISDAIDTVATTVKTEAIHIEEATAAKTVKTEVIRIEEVAVQTAVCGKIEVCTGGKCKKNGSQQVLAAFQSRIEGSPAVVASKCKCMGMCGKGPNVRLQKNEDGKTLVVNGVDPEDVDLLLQELFQISSLSTLPVFLASTKQDLAF